MTRTEKAQLTWKRTGGGYEANAPEGTYRVYRAEEERGDPRRSQAGYHWNVSLNYNTFESAPSLVEAKSHADKSHADNCNH